MSSRDEEKLPEQFLPIVRPSFMYPRDAYPTNISFEERIGRRMEEDNLGVRFCRKKFKCVIIFMLLIVSIMLTSKELLSKIDEETLNSILNLSKKSESLEKTLSIITDNIFNDKSVLSSNSTVP